MSQLLKMKNITKTFPGVKALDDVELTLNKGEIHALVGENGAGKSTLMKILCGAHKADNGIIKIEDEEVEIHNTRDSQKLGISMIYQHLNLIPDLTVAENIFIGRFPQKNGVINYEELNQLAKKQLEKLDSKIDPEKKLGDLTVANQQIIAIVKAISYNSKIIILDEPTSSLSLEESEKLFKTLKKLKKQGISMIFITHHMDEIFGVVDSVTILRDGQYMGRYNISELTEETLVEKMVGRTINNLFPKKKVDIGDKIFEVKNISGKGIVENISFELKSGEILGIGGLVGAGRTELVQAIFGHLPHDGKIYLEGKEIHINHPLDAVKNGIVLVPEDRNSQGLIERFNIKDNISLPKLKKFVNRLSINVLKEREYSEELVDKFNVKTPSIKQLAKNLSGGNQQKLVLAKWLGVNPKVLILDEPTKGIDVGSKSEIHKTIGKLASQGIGIIMISSELPELLGVSDNIMVMSQGKKSGEYNRENATAEKVMIAATGANKEED